MTVWVILMLATALQRNPAAIATASKSMQQNSNGVQLYIATALHPKSTIAAMGLQ